MKRVSATTVQFRDLHPYVFCEGYRLPKGLTGKYQLTFSAPEGQSYGNIQIVQTLTLDRCAELHGHVPPNSSCWPVIAMLALTHRTSFTLDRRRGSTQDAMMYDLMTKGNIYDSMSNDDTTRAVSAFA
jgi:hypothetical protein